MLLNLLPLLEGWKYTPKEVGPTSIDPGKSLKIHIGLKPGWLITATGVFSGHSEAKYATLKARVDAYSFDATPIGLYIAGSVNPIVMGLWSAKYDTTNNIYTIAFTPAYPLPISREIVVELLAPALNTDTGTPITTPTDIHGACALIEIIDLDAFKKSVKEVLGVKI